MTINILMPALSPTMTEGNLAKWHKKEGDRVEPGDVIAEVETDKALMDVEAVDEGVLGRIVVPEGAEGVPVNQVIGVLLEEGEDAAALAGAAAAPAQPAAAPAPAPSAPTPAPAPSARPNGNGQAPAPSPAPSEVRASPLARRMAELSGIDLGAVPGSGPRGRVVRADIEAALGASGAPIKPSATEAHGGAGTAPSAAPAQGAGERVFVSPLARRMAADQGLDLAAVAGSGPEGRIVKRDIEQALKAGTARAPSPAARPSAPAPAGPAEELVKMSAMRRVIATRMTESKTTVPHFYLSVDCEIDDLLKARADINELREADGVKLSVNDFIIRACALALRDVPAANVTFAGEGMMRRHNTVDIAVAVAIDGGLITPVIRNADTKDLAALSAEMKELATRARAAKLLPEEYQGGTFSISNLGMYGVKSFDAVINPPQAGILAVGAGEKRPVVKGDTIVPATVMSCTLSCDHRVVDGAIGAQLLAAIKRYIERPIALVM